MSQTAHVLHALDETEIKLKAVAIISILQGKTILKVDFRGSDLVLNLSDGNSLIVSAVENTRTGKPSLDAAVSCRIKAPAVVEQKPEPPSEGLNVTA